MVRLAWLWTNLARQMRGPGSAIEETEQNSDRMESQNSESGSSEKQARVPRRSSAGAKAHPCRPREENRGAL